MEEVINIHAFNITYAACEHVEGNDYETAVGMFFCENLDVLKMLVLYFFCGFDLDGYAGITNDDINLNARVGTPIGKALVAMGVVQPCHQLLCDQMFEGMTIVCRAPYELLAVKQMVDNADVEIIETRCLYQSAFHHFCKGRNAVTQKGVFEDVEIGVDRGSMYSTSLCNIVIVDDFSIGECRHFQKSMECFVLCTNLH